MARPHPLTVQCSAMTTASAPGPPTRSRAAKDQFDPDSYRMTLGEHLEELRMRLILGLGAFLVAAVVFLIPAIGEHVVKIFVRPLAIALQRNHLPPQIYYTE